MATLTPTEMNAVTQWFNHYHKKVKDNPNFYVDASNSVITAVLPIDLIRHCEPTSGHSGFGAGARPLGLRESGLMDARATLARRFASIDTLVKWIETSPGLDNATLKSIYNGTYTPPKKVKKKKTFAAIATVQELSPTAIKEVSTVAELFAKYAEMVKPNQRIDFKEDLYDVAAGNVTIDQLLAEYE